jgi:type I restriction-modification system DNA methylase subunit
MAAKQKTSPKDSSATIGFVLANGSMSSNQSGEGEIRKALIEADLVDCMVAASGTPKRLSCDVRN